MEVKTTYVGTLNGVHSVWCGFKPADAVITKEIPVLYPSTNFQLLRKGTEKLLNYVVLIDDDNEKNYEEVEIKKEEEPKEDKDAE